MDLFKAKSIEEALEELRALFPQPKVMTKALNVDLLGDVLSEDVLSPIHLPHFPRSTVDGYAVIAEDTYGSSESAPSLFHLLGAAQMGQETKISLGPLQTCYVPTGGMLPEGASGMVMIEDAMVFGEEVAILKPAAPGDNIMPVGSDVRKGDLLLKAGTIIRPKDLGLLAGAGLQRVAVYKRPRALLLSTGDELVTKPEDLGPGKILDINSYTLLGMLKEAGVVLDRVDRLRDNYQALQEHLQEAVKTYDLILVSGGSSMGDKDYTAKLFHELGSPGVLTHGLFIKPGKPTILGLAGETLLVGLPGQPVSAMVVLHEVVLPLLRDLFSLKAYQAKTSEGILGHNIFSSPGKTTYIMMKKDDKGLLQQVHGKSGMISMIARADGMVKIPANREGFDAGTTVTLIEW